MLDRPEGFLLEPRLVDGPHKRSPQPVIFATENRRDNKLLQFQGKSADLLTPQQRQNTIKLVWDGYNSGQAPTRPSIGGPRGVLLHTHHTQNFHRNHLTSSLHPHPTAWQPASAVIIQAYWRGYWTRKRLRSRKYGLLLKSAVGDELEDSAARVIQRFFRGFLGRLISKDRLQAVIMIQKWWRGYSARKGWRQRLRNWRWQSEAATEIQRWVRGHLARIRAGKRHSNRHRSLWKYPLFSGVRDQAASIIQKCFRGYKDRKRYRWMKLQQSKKERWAAVVIQRHYRSWAAQKHVLKSSLSYNSDSVSFLSESWTGSRMAEGEVPMPHHREESALPLPHHSMHFSTYETETPSLLFLAPTPPSSHPPELSKRLLSCAEELPDSSNSFTELGKLKRQPVPELGKLKQQPVPILNELKHQPVPELGQLKQQPVVRTSQDVSSHVLKFSQVSSLKARVLQPLSLVKVHTPNQVPILHTPLGSPTPISPSRGTVDQPPIAFETKTKCDHQGSEQGKNKETSKIFKASKIVAKTPKSGAGIPFTGMVPAPANNRRIHATSETLKARPLQSTPFATAKEVKPNLLSTSGAKSMGPLQRSTSEKPSAKIVQDLKGGLQYRNQSSDVPEPSYTRRESIHQQVPVRSFKQLPAASLVSDDAIGAFNVIHANVMNVSRSLHLQKSP